MLPPNVLDLLNEQISTDLQTKGTKKRDLEQRAAYSAMMPGGGGGRMPGKQPFTYMQEIGLRAGIISEAMKKVLTEIRVSPYDGLVTDTLSVFDTHFEEMVGPIRDRVMQMLRDIGIQGGGDGGLGEKIEDWRASNRMEVKRLASAIMEPVLRPGMVSIAVNNSQVGAIQTGDNATIGTGISITSQESTALLGALSELKQALAGLSGLNEQTREELREVVIEAEQEVLKPKANRTKLSALLSMIAVAIRNRETIKGAYDIVVAFLNAHGIHILSGE